MSTCPTEKTTQPPAGNSRPQPHGRPRRDTVPHRVRKRRERRGGRNILSGRVSHRCPEKGSPRTKETPLGRTDRLPAVDISPNFRPDGSGPQENPFLTGLYFPFEREPRRPSPQTAIAPRFSGPPKTKEQGPEAFFPARHEICSVSYEKNVWLHTTYTPIASSCTADATIRLSSNTFRRKTA